MPLLYHYPLCPHSRFVRLTLAEYGVAVELIEERATDRRPEFLSLDPAGRTPVFIDDDGTIVPSAVIAEYLDETYGAQQGPQRLLPPEKLARIETRRLVDWFNVKFFEEVTSWLVTEKVYKRFSPQGGAPDMDLVRIARANVRHHMRYIGYLTGARNWIAGDRLTYADFAAAAHLSCVDYLGDAPWEEDEAAKHWYQRIKSRPAFRPLLADRAPGMTPGPYYAELDF
ncbi:glutathione S-transferase family protein [Methylocystis sp. Sn-Cys]|uniref:glutathione S-transferase family protein n=1 Tax=Methylocystis sp. Sn-Cys TaxID=1701263 RepID=UPI001924D815|nr:glutathione S-transferase family protein [Methylocystis sp. Sn-Cys]MBL1258426.1 glutathione S-transferase family protein [Methylocystis sp. Sn-Cys]